MARPPNDFTQRHTSQLPIQLNIRSHHGGGDYVHNHPVVSVSTPVSTRALLREQAVPSRALRSEQVVINAINTLDLNHSRPTREHHSPSIYRPPYISNFNYNNVYTNVTTSTGNPRVSSWLYPRATSHPLPSAINGHALSYPPARPGTTFPTPAGAYQSSASSLHVDAHFPIGETSARLEEAGSRDYTPPSYYVQYYPTLPPTYHNWPQAFQFPPYHPRSPSHHISYYPALTEPLDPLPRVEVPRSVPLPPIHHDPYEAFQISPFNHLSTPSRHASLLALTEPLDPLPRVQVPRSVPLPPIHQHRNEASRFSQLTHTITHSRRALFPAQVQEPNAQLEETLAPSPTQPLNPSARAFVPRSESSQLGHPHSLNSLPSAQNVTVSQPFQMSMPLGPFLSAQSGNSNEHGDSLNYFSLSDLRRRGPNVHELEIRREMMSAQLEGPGAGPWAGDIHRTVLPYPIFDDEHLRNVFQLLTQEHLRTQQRARAENPTSRQQRRGLTKEEIERVAPEAEMSTSSPDIGECCICKQDVEVGEMIRNLPCRHEMHRDCIDRWLLDHRRCPVCRSDLI